MTDVLIGVSPDAARVQASLKRVKSNYAPPPQLKVSEFAEREIVLTSGPLAGTRWRNAFAPYQVGIMDAFHEDGVEIAVVMGSSQWGKTSIAVNVAGYHIKHDPCTILIVEPTLDPMATDFATNRLEPVIEASPTLQECFSKKKSKDAQNTKLNKRFRGGSLALAGANSAASLAARPTRVLILDEVDRYPLELPGEGNTISIAMKRTTTFRRRKRILMLSSPTIEDAPIHSWYERGDQRKYFVPCPDCGFMHPFEWANVKWDHDDPLTARLECPACGHAIDDAARIAILANGEWRPTNKIRREKRIVSFHMWEAYSPLSALSDIVAAFLAAMVKKKAGDRSEHHTWQNTTLGEPVPSDDGEGVESNVLMLRREETVPDVDVPYGACCLTMGVDTQDDRLELVVIAWGPGEESWVVDRDTLPGDTSQPGPWLMLDEVLDAPYRHAGGQMLHIQATCIDSAGHRTTMVYDYAEKKAARRVYAIIGRDGQRPIVSSPSPKKWGRNQRQVPLYTIGVDAAKSLLVSRLALTEKGPGYVHLPHADWCDDEFAAQLASERLVRRKVRGLPVQVWKKIRPRNEALDCAVYATAAMRLLNPRLAVMAQQLAAMSAPPPPLAGAPPHPVGPTPRRPRVARSRYLS
jgi:phage terminase large subunit GpA-like protein